MNTVLAEVKNNQKKPYFKVLSNGTLFTPIDHNSIDKQPYNSDHNLDEDSWFSISDFSSKEFCIDLIKKDFDSKDFDNLTRNYFSQIKCIISMQDDDFYFQKITPSLFITKRMFLALGETSKIEQADNRIVIHNEPDAIYYKSEDILIFKKLPTISSIFDGIDQLYREATQEEVNNFVETSFIELENKFSKEEISKSNRKRIAAAMSAINKMNQDAKKSLSGYINEYCKNDLNFNEERKKFSISTNTELKLLLYGIQQRFYTTPFDHEKRLANSVTTIS